LELPDRTPSLGTFFSTRAVDRARCWAQATGPDGDCDLSSVEL